MLEVEKAKTERQRRITRWVRDNFLIENIYHKFEQKEKPRLSAFTNQVISLFSPWNSPYFGPNHGIILSVDLTEKVCRLKFHIEADALDNTVSMAHQRNRTHALENHHKPNTRFYRPLPYPS